MAFLARLFLTILLAASAFAGPGQARPQAGTGTAMVLCADGVEKTVIVGPSGLPVPAEECPCPHCLCVDSGGAAVAPAGLRASRADLRAVDAPAFPRAGFAAQRRFSAQGARDPPRRSPE